MFKRIVLEKLTQPNWAGFCETSPEKGQRILSGFLEFSPDFTYFSLENKVEALQLS